MRAVPFLLLLFALCVCGFVWVMDYSSTELRRIEIGLVVPLTGPNSRKGGEHVRAVALAAHALQREPGAPTGMGREAGEAYRGVFQEMESGRLRFAIAAFDTAAEGPRAFQAYLEHVDAPSRTAHIGVVAFQTSAVLTDTEQLIVASRDPIPLVSIPAATRTFERTGPPRSQAAIRYCPTNRQVARAMVESMPSRCETPALIVSSDDEYARDLANRVDAALREKCGEVEVEQAKIGLDLEKAPLGPDSTHAASHPRGIYFCGSHPDALAYLEALLEKAEPTVLESVTFVGSDALHTREFALRKIAQDAEERLGGFLLASLLPNWGSRDQRSVEIYFESYRDLYDEEPDGFGYHSWRAAKDLLREFAVLRSEQRRVIGAELTARLGDRLRSKYLDATSREPSSGWIIEAFPHQSIPRVEELRAFRERLRGPAALRSSP